MRLPRSAAPSSSPVDREIAQHERALRLLSATAETPLGRPKDYRGRTALVIAVAGIVYALLGHLALLRFPYSGDEYSYVLQAEGFARGVLKAKAPAYADLAPVDHVVIDDFVRSKYPPGTSALLALGVKAGAPWLVTPLEAVLALILTWFVARLVLDPRRAFLTVAFLAAMPLFAYQAATFLSHTASLLWMALASLAVGLWGRRKQYAYLMLFGVADGLLFLTRPLDGLLVGLSLAVFADLPALLIAGGSALPFVGAELWYDKLQFGSFLSDGYRAYAPALAAAYGPEGAVSSIGPMYIFSLSQLWYRLTVVETLLTQWTVPGSALVACLGWVALRREQKSGNPSALPLQRFFGMVIALFVLALFITFCQIDDGPRPRYLTVLLLPMAFFAAAGWRTAAAFVREHLGRNLSWVLGAALWIAPAFSIAAYLEHRVPEVVAHKGLSDELERQHITAGVVVVRAEWPTRYARNGMFFDHPPLLLSVGPNVSVSDVSRRFPGQALYEAFEPHGDNPWKHPWVIRRVQ